MPTSNSTQGPGPGPTLSAPPLPQGEPVEAPLAWGARVSPSFRQKVSAGAARLGSKPGRLDPNTLMAIMAFESGHTFSPAKRNDAGSSAVGLFQFMPRTARALGQDPADLPRMSAEDQLDLGLKYLAPYKGRIDGLNDAYMAVLYPKAIGKPDDYAVFSRATSPIAYSENHGLDANHDGVVTKAEAAAPVAAALRKGLSRANTAYPDSGQGGGIELDASQGVDAIMAAAFPFAPRPSQSAGPFELPRRGPLGLYAPPLPGLLATAPAAARPQAGLVPGRTPRPGAALGN